MIVVHCTSINFPRSVARINWRYFLVDCIGKPQNDIAVKSSKTRLYLCTYLHAGIGFSLDVAAMVSVVAEDAEDRPSGGEVSDGEAPDDPLLPREVDVVRRGHEPPVDGSGHQAGHEPLRPVDAARLGVLLDHHRPGQDRDKFSWKSALSFW